MLKWRSLAYQRKLSATRTVSFMFDTVEAAVSSLVQNSIEGSISWPFANMKQYEYDCELGNFHLDRASRS